VTARARFALRVLVIASGAAATLAGALALRLADWRTYAVYLALSFLLFAPAVEVVPGLALPMPSLALTIGFVYVGGLPVVFLRNLAPPTCTQLVRFLLPERWHDRLPERFWATQYLGARRSRTVPRSAVGAEWAMFSIGLGVRWCVASRLVPDGVPAGYPMAVLVAELAGYLCWTALSFAPILSFSDVLFARPEARLRTVQADLGLVMVLGLTPFVFLITYGYAAHGLPGAAAWSLAGLGLHFMLKRLNERRITVEQQNQRLETLNRELEHRERLSAIGKMSSVVSHQMLQQLGVIGLHADLIRHAGDAEPAALVAQARTAASAIESALGDVNRVLTDLLVFSRDLRLNLYEHGLGGVVTECVDECRPAAAASGVGLRVECPAPLDVTLDKLKMKQALANVVRNAIEASRRGGEVVVRVAVRDGWAEVTVTDQGPGVPEPDREAVFTPFFTTKERGTGLGLAIARVFTEAHGGRLSVDGGRQPGATFVLRLPLHRAGA
jgi:signal transduction histidine kinase